MRFLKLLILALPLTIAVSCKNDEKRGPVPEQEEEVVDSTAYFNESDNEPDRVIWQKPEMVMELLGNLKNKVVADIGAGTGFFTFRLLQQAKKVIAVDIDKAPLDKMRSLAQKLDTSIAGKLEIKLASPSDPGLEPESVDIVFMSNTYMYIDSRIQYLRNLRKYLKKGAEILIIDYKKKSLPFGPPIEERIDLGTVEEELTAAGYRIRRSDDVSLDYQYIVLAGVMK